MKDIYGRTINYMRISVTDRCNLRCRYCMPEAVPWLPMEEILTYEEIALICQEAVKLGITRFKITGGEPLVRRGCPRLVQMLKAIPGVEQVTMTTNGVLLGEFLHELKEAGLDGVNISLDTLAEERYAQITGFSQLPQVLDSLKAAVETGFMVKVNAVLQRGINEEEWWRLAELAREYPVHVRFIELMPIGCGKEKEGVSNDALLERMRQRYGRPGEGNPASAEGPRMPLERETQILGNGPAVYYKLPGFSGRIGFISAIHGKFCGSCNRLRLTSTGELKPCLCFENTIPARDAARRGDREEVSRRLIQAVREKPGMHEFEQSAKVTETRQMSQIGG